MPKVRNFFRDGKDVFHEDDILPPGMNIELRAKQTAMLWNERIEEDDARPAREVLRVEIINAFLHEHVWVVRIGRKYTGGTEYVSCNNCKVTGTRYNDGSVTNDNKWQSDYYEFCHEEKPKLRPPTFK